MTSTSKSSTDTTGHTICTDEICFASDCPTDQRHAAVPVSLTRSRQKVRVRGLAGFIAAIRQACAICIAAGFHLRFSHAPLFSPAASIGRGRGRGRGPRKKQVPGRRTVRATGIDLRTLDLAIVRPNRTDHSLLLLPPQPQPQPQDPLPRRPWRLPSPPSPPLSSRSIPTPSVVLFKFAV